MLHANPCSIHIVLLFYCILLYYAFPRTFHNDDFTCNPCAVAILVTFEALCYLERRSKSYSEIVSIIDIAAFCDAFFSRMIVVEISDNGAILPGGFIIFAAKSNFADSSVWKFVGSFDCLNGFGFFQIQVVYG
jgi:hypothetical protein